MSKFKTGDKATKKSIVKLSVSAKLSKEWMKSAKKLGISRNAYLLSIIEAESPSSCVFSKNFKEGSFERFWEGYPNKKSKQQSKRAFLKLTKKEIDAIFIVYKDHLESWHLKDIQFIPHASTWLNQKRWEDEIELNEEKFIFNNSEKSQNKNSKPKQLNFFKKVMNKLKA